MPLSTCHVRSGPWTTWRVTGPDRTVAPWSWRPASRQFRSGTPVTLPCRANQAAAATGVGWPPRSDTRDSANADPLAQADLAVAAAGEAARAAWAGAGGALPDPHADAARRQAKMQLPDVARCNAMLV